MKQKLILFIAAFLTAFVVNAQNIAFINTETVLQAIPAYMAAQDELATTSDKYKAAIETEVGKIEALYQSYQSKKSLMTASQRSAAEEEIISKERIVKEKQKLYFGDEGLMSKKSAELLDPIRSKVDVAIEAAVDEIGNIEIVVDLAANQDIVYYNSKRDITEKVIEIYKKLNN